MVRLTRVGSVGSCAFSVSLTGTAATAPSPARAWPITASITPRSTNGLAPSCTSTIPQSEGRARSPAATESLRSRPPATIVNPEPMSGARNAGGLSAWSGARTTTTRATSGWLAKGRRARKQYGDPGHGKKLLGDLAAEAAPLPRRHHHHADVTRQARAPAARHGRARPSRRRRPVTCSGTSRRRGGSRVGPPPRSAARSRRWAGSLHRGRSRRGR